MKNKILKTITAIMGFLFFMSMCCFNEMSEHIYLVGMVLMISGAWIALFYEANKERFEKM